MPPLKHQNFTRREFLSTTAAALATAIVPSVLGAGAAGGPSAKPLRVLILGGTGFLGIYCTESALARGHKVTQFNSGRTEDMRRKAGRPSVVPAGVEQLYGNRDPNKTADDRRFEGVPDAKKDTNSPKGLSQLEGKQWDAVIDTSGYFPRMVNASAELLKPNVSQYVFISTVSVYQDNDKPGADETASVQTLADPTTEDLGKEYENFGGGKALCEKAAEAAMPGRVTTIRPGFIVGPRDTSGRFIYWPVRVSLGGKMIVPGKPEDPMQLIDVRDLADWTIHCLETRAVGVYNATGPEKPMTMQAMLTGIRNGLGSQVSFAWVDNGFLEANGVGERFPLYVSPAGKDAGFHRRSNARALAKGLRFRPIADTAKATFEWYQTLPAELQPRIAPQFASAPGKPSWLETEKQILAKWKEHGA
jgi:2'-hydroxyisoflavone reductase